MKRGTIIAAAATVVVGLSISGIPPSTAVPHSAGVGGDRAGSPLVRAGHGDHLGGYDARHMSLRAQLQTASHDATKSGPLKTMTSKLGSRAMVDVDALTGTPRQLSVDNGYLTGKSSKPATTIATTYVRQHAADLGLRKSDLSTFTLRKDYRDIAGIHHLSWIQSVHGVPVFGNGLKVNVTKDGRILSIQGSPVANLRALAAKAPASSAVSASAARAAAGSDVNGKVQTSVAVASKSAGGDTLWSNHDFATRVWFLTPTGLRRGWSTYVQTGPGAAYQHVIDAATGRVLFRRSTVDSDRGDAYVFSNYPGAADGGKAHVVNVIKLGWLPPQAQWLTGRNVIAWSDVNDDNAVNPGEKTPVPGTAQHATWRLARFPHASTLCSPSYVCTWNPNRTRSWRINRKADVTNAFYLANTFHDYLKKAPIGFTPRAGNFETAGGDPVLLNALDGAATDHGMPDGNHIDNANMSTPPDGVPPTMQMYLWHFPGATDAEDPFVAASGSFEADVLFHEYTHGLSNRLVVDAQGNSTLNSIQAGAMGEAWSDYYAMDYLAAKGLFTDTARSGELLIGKYVAKNQPFIRTMPIDCALGATAPACTDSSGNRGGYTYGDFATVIGRPEVHASGEIWGQTLWDIRKAVGHRIADSLITRGMSLSPDDPSFLDMRNAILQADQAVYGSRHRSALWGIFAHRGMGWFAGAIDSGDAFPAEDFHRPPPLTPQVTVAGTVTDPINGDAPVAGAVVHITGHDSGFVGDYTAVTNASGHYAIRHVRLGVYAKVIATKDGYELATQSISTSDPSTMDFQIRRDWAASSGGGAIVRFNGPDYSAFSCGPPGAIDTSQGTGWGSTAGDDAGTPTNVFVPKFIVVDMHATVDITSFAVDPTATCGDAGSASTGDFRIETSADRHTWTTAATGTFGTDDLFRYNQVNPTGASNGVRFVKFWILGNQVPDFATNCPNGPFSGCSFADLTELEVFGTAGP